MARRAGVATTWWGKRWTSALEALGAAWRNRLPRGRTYAREGRVVGLTVEPGVITSYVVGSQPSPYEVAIRLQPLADSAWALVIEQLSQRASYTARLLAGEMPEDIDEAFDACDVSLFPADSRDFEMECTCPDKATPCKHAAATHYMLGETFDTNPFLLFALRGRDRRALLQDLREARIVGMRKRRAEGASEEGWRAEIEALEKLVESSAENGVTETADDARASAGTSPTALPRMSFHIEAPAARLAVLKSLGKPSGWRDAQSLAALLDQGYSAGSQLAQALALGEETIVNDPLDDEGPEPL